MLRCWPPSRLLLPFLCSLCLNAAPSAALQTVLDAFHTEGPAGWAFTQTVKTADRSRVETYDPRQPNHLKMTLISENGHAPTDAELNKFREEQTKRGDAIEAPNIIQNLDLESANIVGTANGRESWRFRLKPADEDDVSAAHMQVTLQFHPDSQTIEQIELASFEPFSPAFGVKVELARTRIDYSLPAADGTPSLLQRIAVTVRGRAFLFKSLDSDLTIEYSDHHYVGLPSSS